jgi:succinate dehydrogenase/fumarate reductase flavoprotein subunit
MQNLSHYHTIIIGSGAAGLNCAIEIEKRNIPADQILIITEELNGGTSHEAGSDKQTYYKLSLVGSDNDSPMMMAHSLYDGGSMHGDIALIEANCSIQAFMNLVNLKVPFPHDKFGAFIGYKTDNDNLQRGTSIGPLTSRSMQENLLEEVQKRKITILTHQLVLQIVKDPTGTTCGVVVLSLDGIPPQSKPTEEDIKRLIQFYAADFVVLATGGPSGMYRDSVYPVSQWGATSLAIQAGASLQNLTESQYGIASLKFKWNLSGTYQQVIPRYISYSKECDALHPNEEPKEFLRDYFRSDNLLFYSTFLKGYQWPFNPERIHNFGSSLIDMAIYVERAIKKRKVYLDILHNPTNFTFDGLSHEAKNYLENSGATQTLPIDRLYHMNPKAIELFRSHGIDLWKEPLEVGICAQHSNGGVVGDIWWQTTIPHLFAIGEVNGSHGVHRPGGSALNAGQVGGIRAAEKITNGTWENINRKSLNTLVELSQYAINQWVDFFTRLIKNGKSSYKCTLDDLMEKIQERMMHAGAYIREKGQVLKGLEECDTDLLEYIKKVTINEGKDLAKAWKVYDSLVCQLTYLTSILEYINNNGGSRGGFMIVTYPNDTESIITHPNLKNFPLKPRNHELDAKILEIRKDQDVSQNQIDFDMKFSLKWTDRRPIPEEKGWFETIWKQFDQKEIFNKSN